MGKMKKTLIRGITGQDSPYFMGTKIWLRRFQYFIAKFIYIFGNGIIQILNKILFFQKATKNPQSILIFRTGNLGDAFCAVPAIKAVQKRFPTSKFIFMTANERPDLPHSVGVLKGMVEFDEIITYNTAYVKNPKYLFELITQLRKKNLDLMIYLSQDSAPISRFMRDMIFFRVAGCKSACGFQWTKHRFFKLSQQYFRKFNREVVRLMAIIAPLGISCKIAWDIPSSSLNFNWPSSEILNSRPIIAIHPMTKFPVNRWPIERFIEVVRILQEKYNSFVVIVGGKESRKEAQEIEANIRHNALNLAGKTSFLQLAEVLKRCDLLISSDSGPVHVASAVGTPVVGIYSARDYSECWYPWGNHNRILRKDPPCQVCLKTECETMDCIKSITVDEVLMACDEILKKNRLKVGAFKCRVS
jgi:ADP-heptose:LPS heptosyltransferase